MPKKHNSNRIGVLSLLLCLLLTGCRTQPPPSSPSPSPSPSPLAEPWLALTLEELPDTAIIPAQSNGSLPSIFLLWGVEEEHISLYGLSEEYGGGILLRQEDSFTHFQQRVFPQDLSLAQMPTLWWQDFDGDGQSELAVKYHTGQDETGGCTFDLIFYDNVDGSWTSASADRNFCADTVLKDIVTDWNERTHTCTLTHGGQQITIPFPADTAPGRLVVGHLCLFTEEKGQFTVILDAWFPTLSTSAATFRAQVLYDGTSVGLQNIRMDFFAGV